MHSIFQIYAPWCGHCQSLEPTYNKLAKHLRAIESIVIAKMDGTTNEHPRAKVIPESNIAYSGSIHTNSISSSAIMDSKEGTIFFLQPFNYWMREIGYVWDFILYAHFLH